MPPTFPCTEKMTTSQDHRANQRKSQQASTRRPVWILLALAALVLVLWTAWSESHPQAERNLRVEIQERLDAWFPEQMQPREHEIGFFRNSHAVQAPTSVDVVLVHGMDEPGGIWTRLQARFDAEGIGHIEFRYPNDQAIDASADELAHHWPHLETQRPVALIGHSMGGLIIRDFTSRHRHPVGSPATVDGPAVQGAILIGTPNHGSEWARLRAGLELREFAADVPAGRFSLFAALRDGTGAAKIDLRPGSRYLEKLNARPWPDSVPIRIIGGRIAGPTPVMEEQLSAVSDSLDLPELEQTIEQLWAQGGKAVGDGAVPVPSLSLPEAPPPLILEASHRGLIADMPWSDREPLAIQHVVDYLAQWRSPTQAPPPPQHQRARPRSVANPP